MELKPIEEHSYTWIEGFTMNNKEYEKGMRQIDWDTVKEILESGEYDEIEVGLAEDYNQTSAVIFTNGKVNIIENGGSGFYGASCWATPAVKLKKGNVENLYECWVLGQETKFPEWLMSLERNSTMNIKDLKEMLLSSMMKNDNSDLTGEKNLELSADQLIDKLTKTNSAYPKVFITEEKILERNGLFRFGKETAKYMISDWDKFISAVNAFHSVMYSEEPEE